MVDFAPPDKLVEKVPGRYVVEVYDAPFQFLARRGGHSGLEGAAALQTGALARWGVPPPPPQLACRRFGWGSPSQAAGG